MNKQLVHSRFEDIASKNGNNVAIEYADIQISYAQLNSYANRVANALVENGLSKGNIVGAFFESSIDYVISILGINKAGGAFMPLEPDFPVKRLISLLNDTQPAVIITHPNLLTLLVDIISDTGITVNIEKVVTVSFDNNDLKINIYNDKGYLLDNKEYEDQNIDIDLDGNDTNYIIYTSGSTGTPKIIEGCHKGLSHFIHWQINEFNLGIDTRVSQLAPLSFDVSFRDIFAPLLAGGTLCIPEKGLRFQPHKLLKWLISSKVNLVHCVPTLFRLLTEECKSLHDIQDALKNLKYILLAGEPLFGRDVENWRLVAGQQIQLVNIYGPSETTLAKMFHRITETNINPASTIQLGKAISNTAILILNENRLCQSGEPGRIYIKTPFRSKGYLKNPQMTKERFIQNPLHNEFEDIIYDTGDIGKYLENMDVAFLGRNDNQIKIRGNRIELLEVEKILISYAGISAVAVVVINSENDDDAVLACYYTGDKIDEAKVKVYLSNYLSQYMHPSFFVHLKDFPLNSSGKIDKKALPVPANIEKDTYEAPINDTERALENIWKEILKVQKVSRNESFFNIGGSSLKGIKIISKIYKQCNVLIKLPDLFVNPTIKQLGELLAKSEQKSYNEIKQLDIQPYYELSHAQRRLWILSNFEEEHIAYNMLYAYKFKGNLNVDCFNKALQTIIARHESMRTVFITVNDEPKQKILTVDELDFELNKEDLRLALDPYAAAKKIAEEEFRRPFDLQNSSLVRANLLYLAEDEYVFIFSTHHIISDGWSSNIWMKELVELYDAYKNNLGNPLKPLKLQYKDFAAWQNNLLKGEKLASYQDYWINQFTPAPPVLSLLSDKVRPKIKTYNGKQFAFVIEKDLLQPLKELCNQNEATLFMALLSTVNILFYRLTAQTDITIGTPITGRENEDLEDQIGVFVNTLALRTRFDKCDSFLTLLNKVKEVTSGAYKHQSYPFDYLIDQLNLMRDLSRSPLFDVMIVLHDRKTAGEHKESIMEDVAVTNFYISPDSTKFDLNFNITENNEKLNIVLDYNCDIFTERFIGNLVAVYKNLLKSVITAIDKPIYKLNLIDEHMNKVLNAANLVETPIAPALTLQQLFEQQVKETPLKTALVEGDLTISYSELNSRANSMANYLKDKYAVGIEDTVAVILDRSVNFVVAVLGIIKAGAAFVPLDINYPDDRTQSILVNLKPQAIITEKKYATDQLQRKEVVLIDNWNNIADYENANPVKESSGNNLVYVIYTSGSTGTPKGVAITNTSLINYVQWSNAYYFNNSADYTFAFNTSVAFDLTITSVFTTLLRGDKLVIYSGEADVSYTLEQIFKASSGIDVVKLTPSHISMIGNLNISKTNIKCVIVGGEMFQLKHADILRALNADIKIYNEYGPTEATVGCVVKEITDNDNVVTIGKPIVNTAIYIVDEFNNLQPAGVLGEILIAGKGVAREYYNNGELTDATFIKNPFSDQYSRAYATGDIGYLNLNGEIELAGRRDRQVKIRGHRIELEEIERNLLKHDGITDAFVNIFEDEEGEINMIGYFISSKDQSMLEIRKALKQQLPYYMVPLYFVKLDEFPLTTNGKLDIKALPNSYLTSANTAHQYVAPTNDIERALVSIWESVLNKTPIGIEDDFFELGGHSLNATRIVSKISKELDVRLLLKTIFTHTTIKTLAQQIGITNWLNQPSDINDIEIEVDNEDVYII